MKPTALIIEDNYDISAIFDLTLRSAGFQTEIINYGQQAMERLKRDDLPDVLVCDLHLPERSGRDILEAHQDRLRAHGTKIMLVTADGQGMQLEHLVDMVLLKPVSPRQLSDFSQRLMKIHKPFNAFAQ